MLFVIHAQTYGSKILNEREMIHMKYFVCVCCFFLRKYEIECFPFDDLSSYCNMYKLSATGFCTVLCLYIILFICWACNDSKKYSENL